MTILRRKRLPDGSFGPLEKVFPGDTQEEKVEYIGTDVELIAETVMLNTADVQATAETVSALMDLITNMQAQIDELKGGIA